MSDWVGSVGTALRDAGKGALTGAALGPVGAAGGAALALALDLVPDLAKVVGIDPSAAQKAVTAVQAITHGEEPAAALADPEAMTSLRVELAGIVADHEAALADTAQKELAARLADVANARAATVQLASANSRLAWGAAVVSAVLLVAWFASMLAHYRGWPPLSADDGATLRNLALLVAGYWVGSSSGSARKDERTSAVLTAARLTPPDNCPPDGK